MTLPGPRPPVLEARGKQNLGRIPSDLPGNGWRACGTRFDAGSRADLCWSATEFRPVGRRHLHGDETARVPLTVALTLAVGGAKAAEDVTFVLNWVAGGDHAPVYWAKEQGWYQDAGINLTIEEGRGSAASVQKVSAGAAPFGIADMATALQGRGQGADVVGVMAIYANSPYGLLERRAAASRPSRTSRARSSATRRPTRRARCGRRSRMRSGCPRTSVEWINIKPDAKTQSLQAGVIDATTSYYNLHYVFERVFGDDMGFVALRDIGFNPYGNSIIVNGDYMRAHPDVVENFVKVTQKRMPPVLRSRRRATRHSLRRRARKSTT